jgi:hypothetical protein
MVVDHMVVVDVCNVSNINAQGIGKRVIENHECIPVDLELVLAVDVSSSMDKDE